MAGKKNHGIRKSTAEIIFEIVNYTVLALVALSMLYRRDRMSCTDIT